jgi:DNA-binding CsgD family transcriptional regulator
VLELAAAGHSAAEIAGERRTSRRTVENQLSSGYRKIGVANRSELTALWARKKR